jgi:hypothetical protein
MRTTLNRHAGPRPSCDYGFYAAHSIALEEWRCWVEGQGEASRRLEQASAARRCESDAASRPGIKGMVGMVRQAVGAVLIGVGRYVQGVTAADAATAAPGTYERGDRLGVPWQ